MFDFITVKVWQVVAAICGGLVLVLSFYVWILKSENIAFKTQIDGFNAVSDRYIELQKQKQAETVKEIEKVRVIYKDKIQYIERWTNDTNKTNCENAINFGRAYRPTSLLY